VHKCSCKNIFISQSLVFQTGLFANNLSFRDESFQTITLKSGLLSWKFVDFFSSHFSHKWLKLWCFRVFHWHSLIIDMSLWWAATCYIRLHIQWLLLTDTIRSLTCWTSGPCITLGWSSRHQSPEPSSSSSGQDATSGTTPVNQNIKFSVIYHLFMTLYIILYQKVFDGGFHFLQTGRIDRKTNSK
jgi:hypothetical protein